MPLTLQGIASLFAPRVSPTEGARAFSQSMAGIRDWERIDESKRANQVREFQADQNIAQARANYEETVRRNRNTEELEAARQALLRAEAEGKAVKEMIAAGMQGDMGAASAVGAPLDITMTPPMPGMLAPPPSPQPQQAPPIPQQPGNLDALVPPPPPGADPAMMDNLGVVPGGRAAAPRVGQAPPEAPDMVFEEPADWRPGQDLIEQLAAGGPDIGIYKTPDDEIPAPPSPEEVAGITPRSDAEMSMTLGDGGEPPQPDVTSMQQQVPQQGYTFSTGGGPVNFEAMRQRSVAQVNNTLQSLLANTRELDVAAAEQVVAMSPDILRVMNYDKKAAVEALMDIYQKRTGMESKERNAAMRQSGMNVRFGTTGDRQEWKEGRITAFGTFSKRKMQDRLDASKAVDQAIARISGDNADNPTTYTAVIYGLAKSNDPGARLTDKDVKMAEGFVNVLGMSKEALDRYFSGTAGAEHRAQIRKHLRETKRLITGQAIADYKSLKAQRDAQWTPTMAQGFDQVLELYSGEPWYEAARADDEGPKSVQGRSEGGGTSASVSVTETKKGAPAAADARADALLSK